VGRTSLHYQGASPPEPPELTENGWWLVEATLVYASKQTLINGCLGK